MSFAYGRLLAELEEGVEPPSPREFTRVDCSNLPSMTRQSEADACDINKILARYDVRMMEELEALPLRFSDVSDVGSFRDVLDRTAEAEAYFSRLSAGVRAAFGNDVARFVDEAGSADFDKKFEELGVKKEGGGSATPPPPAQ